MVKIDKEIEKRLWEKYKEDPSQTNQHLLFDFYYDVAIAIANSYMQTHGCFNVREEVEQYALTGLLDAIKRYDSTKSSFRTYSSYRVRYNIIDEIRKYGKYNSRNKYNLLPVSLDQIREGNESGDFDITEAGESYSQFMIKEQNFIDIINNSKLLKREKQICKLRFVNDYTHEEISKHLNIHQSRISQIISDTIIPFMRIYYLENHSDIVNDFRGG